jgi:hypothetical protein
MSSAGRVGVIGDVCSDQLLTVAPADISVERATPDSVSSGQQLAAGHAE